MLSTYLTILGPLGTIAFYQLYQAKVAELESVAYETNQRIKSLTEELNDKTTQLNKLYESAELVPQEQQDANNKKIKSLREEVDVLKQENKRLTETVNELTKIKQGVDEKIINYQNQVKQLEAKVSQVENEKKSIELDYTYKLNTKIETLITSKDLEIHNLKQTLEDLKTDRQQKLVISNELVKKTEIEIEKYQSDLVDLKLKLDKKTSEYDTLNEKLVVFEQDNKDITSKYEALKSYQEIVDDLYKFQESLGVENFQQLQQQFKELNVTKQDQVGTITKLTKTVDEQAKELEDLQQLNKGYLEKYTKLQKDIDEIKAESTQLVEKYKGNSRDFKLYDIVRFKIKKLYDDIKELIPEIDDLVVDEEDYSVEETLETNTNEEPEIKRIPENKVVDSQTKYLKGNEETQKLTKIFNIIHQTLKTYKETVKSKEIEIEELTAAKIGYDTKVADLQRERDDAVKEVSGLNQNVTQLKLEIESFEEKFKQSNNQAQILQTELDQAKQEIITVSQDVKSMQQANKKLEEARSIIDDKIIHDKHIQVDLQTKIDELNNTINSMNEQLTTSHQDNQALQRNLTQTTRQLEKAQDTIELMKHVISKNANEIGNDTETSAIIV